MLNFNEIGPRVGKIYEKNVITNSSRSSSVAAPRYVGIWTFTDQCIIDIRSRIFNINGDYSVIYGPIYKIQTDFI